jgi:hypothetical protein
MLYTYSDVIYSYKEGEDNVLYNPKDNDALYTQSIYERKLNEGYANIAPEGYIYKPHHKIQIGRFNDLMNESYDTFMEIKELTFRYETIKEDGVTKKEMNITFNTNIDYSLMNGDIISIMNKNNKQLYKFRVKSYNTKTIDGIKIFICEAVSLLDNIEWDLTSISTESGENVTVEPEEKTTIESKNNDEIVPEIICSDEYYCFKHNLFIPDYAYLIPDNSGVCIWRDIVKPSSYTFDDELSKIPFTNGAFYHHKNINFFVYL